MHAYRLIMEKKSVCFVGLVKFSVDVCVVFHSKSFQVILIISLCGVRVRSALCFSFQNSVGLSHNGENENIAFFMDEIEWIK